MRHNLKRYYGAGHLHFIPCSCYRRQPLLGRARRRDLFLLVLEQVRRNYKFVVAGCSDARAYPSAHQRAAKPKSFDRDASSQNCILTSGSSADAAKTQSRAGYSVRHRSAAHLAKALLRLQRLERAQAHREAALHAREPGEAGLGGISGTLALSSYRAYRLGETGRVKVNDCTVLKMKVQPSVK